MEAKTPEAHKGGMDFVKMSIMLKHMLDEMVLRGCHVSDAAVYGSILHDNHVFQYTMTLPFNGIYLMKEVSVGSLPSSPQEIDCLVRLVPRYLRIMDDLKQKAERLELPSGENQKDPYQRATAYVLKEKAE
ncbi:hypothetical protein EDC96DRAFT_547728 [Choanephora cucurbitarum]|nr:hypothetical protein EDC96DRAFT_547728 [Choanephora cucurbitarum]